MALADSQLVSRGARFPARREVLRAGLAGFSTLSLADLFRIRAATRSDNPRTAVILVWLRGGASHFETYDPKPDAPENVRGLYRPIATKIPGMRICELLPRHAQLADRFTILRSVAHTGGGHPSGSLQVLAGDTDPNDKQKVELPDWMTIAHYLRLDPRKPMPNYVGVNAIRTYDGFQIAGPGWLGASYEPFMVTGDPNNPHFEVPNVGLKDASQMARLSERTGLQGRFDLLRHAIDQTGTATAMDACQAQAMNLLTRPEARRAFDISQENDRVRDRYGRNQWGQQCLLARRLVEAGVEIVTTTFDGACAGRVINWDDHSVNQNIFEVMKYRALFFDQAVTALIEDIYQRGLDRRVLVVVTGEFGRTPTITNIASSGAGIGSAAEGVKQPGRDHWPAANSMLFAGGGIQTGQVIGATDKIGAYVKDRKVSPHDFLATIYRHLGIDSGTMIRHFSGRPVPLLPGGRPIAELSGNG